MATLEEQLEPTFGRWSADLRTGRGVTRPLRSTVDDIRVEQLKLLRRATGDGSLSNWPRRGRPIRGDVEKVVRRSRGELRLTPPGLWGLIASGAKPHTIGMTSGRREVLKIGTRFVTGPVNHPGSKRTRKVEPDRKFLEESWDAGVREDLQRRGIV